MMICRFPCRFALLPALFLIPASVLADEERRISISREEGTVRIDLPAAQAESQLVLEVREFLDSSPAWNPILRLNSAGEELSYYDPLCKVEPNRFYRLRQPPFPETGWADNFKLLDAEGTAYELFYHSHVEVIVLLSAGPSLEPVGSRLEEIRSLKEQYGEEIRFWALLSRPEFDLEELGAEIERLGIDFPVLLDAGGVVTRNLGPVRFPEVFAVRSSDWTYLYQGAFSTRVEVGEGQVARHYLRDALGEHFSRRRVGVSQAESPGAPSGLALEQAPSYAEEVAPLLRDHCLECHSKGNIAPIHFDSYEAVVQNAWPIKDQVLAGTMPPWHADRHVGSFVNDIRLSDSEKNVLVSWIGQGAPRGEGADPLRSVEQEPQPDWILGEPDYVVEIPRQSVPAEGVVAYRYLVVDNPVPRDAWIRAAAVIPGDASVVHHSLVFVVSRPEDLFAVQGGLAGFFAGYVPGLEPEFFPEGAGKFVPKGASFVFQQHYTPSGEAATDVTRMGLYLAEDPERELITRSAFTTSIDIPPRRRHNPVEASTRIRQDSWLIELNPHMHYRGKTARYRAVFPDGSSRDLLSVPDYHFDWQRSYRLAEPLFLPEGTHIEVQGSFDNSPQNRWNPDPDQRVGFGEQSWDEMFIGYFNIAVDIR